MKNVLRLTLVIFISTLTTGCLVFGFGSARVIPVGGPPAPNQPAQAQMPALYLEYANSRFTGVQGNFGWHTSQTSSSGSGWGGTWPPNFPSTLTAQVGQNVDIVVSHGQPAAALWVAELNSGGIPSSSVALTSVSNVTAYPLSNAGHYTLMVTAHWSYQDYVTYYFALEVQP